jgi:hypothetical protein
MELTVILGLLLDQWIELGLVEGPCRGREIQVRPFYQDEVIWVAAPFDPLAKVKNPLFHNYTSFPATADWIPDQMATADRSSESPSYMFLTR